MKFSDEMLMAYADGELDLVERAGIEAAMAVDPEVALAVERHRRLAARVQEAYQDVLDEPVPAKLAALVSPPAATPVVRLADHRSARAEPAAMPPTRLPYWAAMAASVAIGLLVGLFLLREPAPPWTESNAGLIAKGDLDYALTTQLAGGTGVDDVRVGISFRDRTGAYCRAFHLQQDAPLAGLACRAGSEWRLQVIAAAAKQEGELRPAAAMPMAVLHAIDAAIDGEPLDAAAESAARDSGWQTPPKLAE
jgi:hypothetical protein